MAGGWSVGTRGSRLIDPQRLRHVSSIVGGSYGAFGDNWAADHLSRIDALEEPSPCASPPAFA